MSHTTDLLGWFLFKSGVPTQRTKTLLTTWRRRGLTLDQALAQLPTGAQALGVSPDEARRLQPPTQPPAMPEAVTWDDPLYPQGLAGLPTPRQPAMLFTQGDQTLLARPIVALLPAPTTGAAPEDAEDGEIVREVISLLLGEPVLLGVYEGSAQHTMLLEEMATSEGEALIFTRAGLHARPTTEAEAALSASGRLVLVSPLPPDAAYRPAWDSVLLQVATAAAHSVILAGAPAGTPESVAEAVEHKPALVLTPAPLAGRVPANVEATALPSDVLVWIDAQLDDAINIAESAAALTAAALTAAALTAASLTAAALTPESAAAHAAGQTATTGAPAGAYGEIDFVARRLGEPGAVDLGPEPTTDEIISTLEKGGQVPEVLLRRLRGE